MVAESTAIDGGPVPDIVGYAVGCRLTVSPQLIGIKCLSKPVEHSNHDGNADGLRQLGFSVQHTLALCATDPPLALSHEPLRQVPPGAICLHGHLHERTEPSVRHVNLSVEQTLYRPVRLARVVEQAREREWISNNRRR